MDCLDGGPKQCTRFVRKSDHVDEVKIVDVKDLDVAVSIQVAYDAPSAEQLHAMIGERWALYCLTNSTTEDPLKSEEDDCGSFIGAEDVDATELDGAKDDFFQNLTQPSTLVVITKLERGVTVTELTVSRCMSDLK